MECTVPAAATERQQSSIIPCLLHKRIDKSANSAGLPRVRLHIDVHSTTRWSTPTKQIYVSLKTTAKATTSETVENTRHVSSPHLHQGCTNSHWSCPICCRDEQLRRINVASCRRIHAANIVQFLGVFSSWVVSRYKYASKRLNDSGVTSGVLFRSFCCEGESVRSAKCFSW